MMHGLIEVDVSEARRRLRAQRERTGEALSFTAFVIACLGRAVAAHPEVHALRDWRGRMVLFDDVDVTTIVEVQVDGRPFGLAHILRAANRRSPAEIHDEIRAVQVAGLHSVSPATRRATRLALFVPGFARRLALRAMLWFPRVAKRQTGTVLMTAVGMFGGGTGWGFSAPGIHGLSVTVGGIAERAAVTPGGRPREVLCLTVSADHEVVDGAPLARFTRDLRALLESADGLPAA